MVKGHSFPEGLPTCLRQYWLLGRQADYNMGKTQPDSVPVWPTRHLAKGLYCREREQLWGEETN